MIHVYRSDGDSSDGDSSDGDSSDGDSSDGDLVVSTAVEARQGVGRRLLRSKLPASISDGSEEEQDSVLYILLRQTLTVPGPSTDCWSKEQE